MLIGCLQMAPEFGAPEANVAHASSLVRGAGANLIVLPELVTTGYRFTSRAEALALAEPVPDGPSTRAFAALAREENVYLAYGIAELAGGKIYNSSALVGPDGLLLLYRKAHLFADEPDVFEPGDLGFPVVDLPGRSARVGMLVCVDWAFPEATRAVALAGADLVLHPSNLVLPHCQRAMVTRSLENGVFTLTANRTGTEDRGGLPPLTFTGGSQVLSPRGETLASLGTTEEGLALAEVDPADARDKMLTPRNSVLGDRRPELYGILTEPRNGDEA